MSLITSFLGQIVKMVKPLLGMIYVLLLIAALPVAVIGGLFAAINLVPSSLLDTIRGYLTSGLTLLNSLSDISSLAGNYCNQTSQYGNGTSACSVPNTQQFSGITAILNLVVNLFDPSNLTSVQGTLQALGYIVLGFGGAMVIVGLVGCCGLCCNKKPMLYLNILFSLILCGGTMAALVLWLNDGLDSTIFNLMIAELKKTYNGTHSQGNNSLINFETNLINFLMAELHCCGLENYTEFQQAFNWYPTNLTYTNPQTNVTTNYGVKIIPETCCVLNSTYLVGPIKTLDQNCTIAPTSNNSYIDLSCKTALSYSHIMGSITAVVIDVLAAFTTFEGVCLLLSIYLVLKKPNTTKPNESQPRAGNEQTKGANDPSSFPNNSSDPSKYPPYQDQSTGPYENPQQNVSEKRAQNFYAPPHQQNIYATPPQISRRPFPPRYQYGNRSLGVYGNIPQYPYGYGSPNPAGARQDFPNASRLRYSPNSPYASPYGNAYDVRNSRMISDYSPYNRGLKQRY